MADEPDEPQQVQQQPGLAQQDWFLQTLVNMANTSDSEIGITLQVGGFLVSGYLVGGSKYFEGFAAEFTGALISDQTTAEDYRKGFLNLAERAYKSTDTKDAPPSLPMFLHLKGARFFNTSGKPIPANRSVWWRGRISEVSGFILGVLSEGTQS